MNDSRFVGGIKGVRHIGCDLKYLSVFQRLAGNDVLQGLPFEQLHYDKGVAFNFIDFVNRANVGMI